MLDFTIFLKIKAVKLCNDFIMIDLIYGINRLTIIQKMLFKMNSTQIDQNENLEVIYLILEIVFFIFLTSLTCLIKIIKNYCKHTNETEKTVINNV